MKNRANPFVSVVLLMVYGTLALVSVPFHFHEDALFATGSGTHEFVQHHDASDCHHHVVAAHDDCTICSVVSHSIAVRSSSLIQLLDTPVGVKPAVIQFIAEHDYHSTHSRRGPPALFA